MDQQPPNNKDSLKDLNKDLKDLIERIDELLEKFDKKDSKL